MAPSVSRGFNIAAEDVRGERRTIVVPESPGFSLTDGIEAMSIAELTNAVATG